MLFFTLSDTESYFLSEGRGSLVTKIIIKQTIRPLNVKFMQKLTVGNDNGIE